MNYNSTVEGIGLLARVKEYDDDDLLDAAQVMFDAGYFSYQTYNFNLTGASIPTQIQEKIESGALAVKDEVTNGIKTVYNTAKATAGAMLDATSNAAKSLMNLPTLLTVIVFVLIGGLIYIVYKKGVKGLV